MHPAKNFSSMAAFYVCGGLSWGILLATVSAAIHFSFHGKHNLKPRSSPSTAFAGRLPKDRSLDRNWVLLFGVGSSAAFDMISPGFRLTTNPVSSGASMLLKSLLCAPGRFLKSEHPVASSSSELSNRSVQERHCTSEDTSLLQLLVIGEIQQENEGSLQSTGSTASTFSSQYRSIGSGPVPVACQPLADRHEPVTK